MNRRHLRHARALPILGVAVLLVGIAVSPATATNPQGAQPAATPTITPAPVLKEETPGGAPNERPPGGFASWEELLAAQNKLNSAADYILSAAPSDTDAAAASGYASTVAAPESGQVVMYWQGAVPADVQARAAQTGVPVRFLAARYSAAELASENTRLGADPRVFTTAPNVDGSGITVTVGNDADAAAIRAEARVAATVSVGPRPQLLWNRQNDISPYWGGAHWYNLTTGGQCSTGFAVRWGDVPRMLTAAHCGANGNLARIGNATQPATTITADVNPRDTQMLNPPQGRTYQGRIYTGPWNSSTSLKVIGSAVDYVGNWICTSGSFSGEHCNARVYAVNTSVLGIFPLTYAAKVPGIPAAGNCIVAPGDSGGPVFHHGLYWQWGWPFIGLGAVGRGTITAGVLDTPCISLGVWRPGSYRVWYAPLRRPWWSPTIGSLQFYGASLL